MAMLSSPLAAMQPPQCPTGRAWGCRQEASDALARKAASNSFGRASRFNFSELAVNNDYFNCKSTKLRDSSPAVSLAADLSQNFYIDQSSAHALVHAEDAEISATAGLTTPPTKDCLEIGTTPHVASSSPVGGFNAMDMDMSPLPHKLPVCDPLPTFAQPPSIRISCQDDVVSPTVPAQNLLPAPRFPAQERILGARPILQRSSLNRSKFMSTSNIHSRHRDSQLCPFTFGASTSDAVAPASLTLDDAFMDSPPQVKTEDHSIFVNPPTSYPRPRFHLASTGSSNQRNPGLCLGNPFGKKPLSSMVRPRKQIRRALSMFQHPEEVIKNDAQNSSTDSMMDVDHVYKLKLPHFIPDDQPDSLPRINQSTMISVLDQGYASAFDEVKVIDCRFEYEYNGGHIQGAHNFNDKKQLAQQLFASSCSTRTLLVFHCEYSAHRAPLMAQYIRQQDRAYNASSYPHLTYPDMYILDGGYSSFFKMHRIRCFPQNYVEMDAKEHEQACERGLNRIKQRSKLLRAQTYAFGMHCSAIQDSPSRPASSGQQATEDDIFAGRLQSRRMASFP